MKVAICGAGITGLAPPNRLAREAGVLAGKPVPVITDVTRTSAGAAR